MFEQYKLKKYAKNMVGFAYLRMDTTPYAKFEIYLVVKKDNEYKFIKFKKFDVGLLSVKEMEEDLLEKGYHPLPYYFRKNNVIDMNKALKLKK